VVVSMPVRDVACYVREDGAGRGAGAVWRSNGVVRRYFCMSPHRFAGSRAPQGRPCPDCNASDPVHIRLGNPGPGVGRLGGQALWVCVSPCAE
jgi:hypothetical protein